MAQWVTVYGPNLPTQGETFHVHAAGCADVRRGFYPGLSKHQAMAWEAESIQEIVEEVYLDQIAESDGEWATWEPYAHDFKIFPCVTL
jgi:hypothetical protein